MLGYLPPLPPHLMGRVGLLPGKGHASTDYTRQGHNFVGENRDPELCSIVVIQTRYLVAVNIFYEFC